MANDDEMKGSRELEQEVEVHRDAVEQTLAELIERFSPLQLLRQFMNQDEEQQPRQWLDLLASNPVPTLIAAGGLGWLLMSRSRDSDTAGYVPPPDEPSRASYGVDPAYDPSSGSGHVALGKSARDVGFENTPGSEADSDPLGSQLSSLLGNQPLLVAAFGLAVGGLLGAALPRLSERETGFSQRLDDANRRSREYASDTGDLADEPVPSGERPIHH